MSHNVEGFGGDEQELRPPFSDALTAVFRRAAHEARHMRHCQVGTPHLLIGLMADESVRRIMLQTGFNPDIKKARTIASSLFPPGPFEEQNMFTAGAQEAIRHVTRQALKTGNPTISPVDLYGQLLGNPNMVELVLDGLRIQSPMSTR